MAGSYIDWNGFNLALLDSATIRFDAGNTGTRVAGLVSHYRDGSSMIELLRFMLCVVVGTGIITLLVGVCSVFLYSLLSEMK